MKTRSVMFVSLCAVVLFGQNAFGQPCTKEHTVPNNTGNVKSDLHYSILNGGVGSSLVVASAPGCPPATVTQLGSSGWTIDWGVLCVDPGESVVLRITGQTAAGNVFSSATWTPGDVVINANDVSAGPCIPTVSEWGLAAMILLMLTAATIVVRKRMATT